MIGGVEVSDLIGRSRRSRGVTQHIITSFFAVSIGAALSVSALAQDSSQYSNNAAAPPANSAPPANTSAPANSASPSKPVPEILITAPKANKPGKPKKRVTAPAPIPRCSRRRIRPARSKPPTATSPVRARRSFRCRAPARPERSSKTCRKPCRSFPAQWLIQQGDNYAAPSHHQRAPASVQGGQDLLGYFDHFLIRGHERPDLRRRLLRRRPARRRFAFAQRRQTGRDASSGPGSALFGSGPPGGTINIVHFQPSQDFHWGTSVTGRLVRHRRQSGLGDRTHDHQRSLLPGGQPRFLELQTDFAASAARISKSDPTFSGTSTITQIEFSIDARQIASDAGFLRPDLLLRLAHRRACRYRRCKIFDTVGVSRTRTTFRSDR